MSKRFRLLHGLSKFYSSKASLIHPQHPCKWSTSPDDIRNVLCDGPILHAVQTSNVFPDCKTFVDMNVKVSLSTIHSEWKKIEEQHSNESVPMTVILKFLHDYFENVDSETQLIKWVPKDWKPLPAVVDKIVAPEYKHFAKQLNHLWLQLARIMSPKVKTDSNKTTLIYIPNGFIIPGGRFRELYYWDTYFILLGLIVCDMFETAKGVVENMLYLVENYGCIYNGTRIYYQFRSQPPLLLAMVDLYVNSTKDFEFIQKNFHIMEREIDFWEKTRSVEVEFDGNKYRVFRYFCCAPGPRPESYREDIATGKKITTDEGKLYKYQAIASACESGWDFSSRWFKCKRGNTLVDTHTQEIIPVDLNSFMHMNYELLRKWATELKMENEIKKYTELSNQTKHAIQNLLWDETDGIWYDFDSQNGMKNKQYLISNFTPLWTQSYDESRKTEIAEKMLEYYSINNLWKYHGGLPTTMCFSGEQWDWPNSWAPLQLIASHGFRNIGLPIVALKIASNWVNNNYVGFLKKNVIYEKYDCRRPGVTGFGGEYEEQIGFGWSNGVLLSFLNDYGNKLKPSPTKEVKIPFQSTRELTWQEERSLM